MSDLELLDLPRTLRDAKVVIERSITRVQYDNRVRIFRKLIEIIDADMPDEEKLARIMGDFETFCVVFVRLDDIMPMFPALWQSQVEKIIEEHKENLFIECRKVGKSALLSAYVVWRMVNYPGERVIVFAPTTQQLFVMEDIYKVVGRNDFIKKKFIGKIGTYGKEHIRFGANEAEVKSSNLALAQDADTKRGEKGSLIIVDEIELVHEDVRNFVIDDMMADSYTKKKMIMVGTPKDVANPNLEGEWRDAQEGNIVGTHHIDMWEGVRQGCIARDWVAMRFRRLRIPCPWGLFRGSCGKMDYPGELYKSETGNTHWEDWECSEICQQNESFVAENLGEFPSIAGKFFPKPFLLKCGERDYIWEVVADPGAQYVIGVDYGLLVNPTQIIVYKVLGEYLRLVYWHEMPAVKPGDESRDGTRSYDPVVRAVKDAYWRFAGEKHNQVRWLFVDATQPGLQVTHDLTKGLRPIPTHRIWANLPAENKQVKGVWFTGQYKDMMFQNYKQLIMDGKIGVPNREPFWGQFLIEHENVKVDKVEGGNANYLKYKPPRGGTIDLIVAMSLGALILSDEVKKKGPFIGYYLLSGKDRPRTSRRGASLTEDVSNDYRGVFQPGE
jgi:hypothetical protein